MFAPSPAPERGRWAVIDSWPYLATTEKSARPVETLMPGVLIGTEERGVEKHDFALVRIRTAT